MSAKLKILSPDAEADLALDPKKIAKIVADINATIRSTPSEARKRFTVSLDIYPDVNTIVALTQMLRDAGWTRIKFECEDRPCGSAWIELGK
jgi:hypothetical protein